jgi:hypothetical protein
MNNIYHPYRRLIREKMEKTNIILLLNQGKQLNLELLDIVISQHIKMKQEYNDILIGTKIMQIGRNQVLIRLGFGLVGCYGICPPLKLVMKI